jgi:hypothetical protein
MGEGKRDALLGFIRAEYHAPYMQARREED